MYQILVVVRDGLVRGIIGAGDAQGCFIPDDRLVALEREVPRYGAR
jgi:hypothetical protein